MAPFSIIKFIREQWSEVKLFREDLSGKTVVVTGANIGLGYEAAKHLAKMKPARLILACRSQVKGDAAVKSIQDATGFKNIECWTLDLADFASVKAFADRYYKDGGSLDILLENAGVSTRKFGRTKDGHETTVQVNHLGTALLGILLLPILAKAPKTTFSPRWVVVSSEVHFWVKRLEEANTSYILETLSNKEHCTPAVMGQRYNVSKLLNVFFTRAVADKLKSGTKVTIDTVNPGFCYSELTRELNDGSIVLRLFLSLFRAILARTTEVGSRTLVHAAIGGTQDEVQGRYLSVCRVTEESDYVISAEGQKIQERLWVETIEILKAVDPRVDSIVKEYFK